MFVFNEKEFEVGFFREVFDNRFSSAAKIRQAQKKSGFPFACIVTNEKKNKLFVSFGPNDDQYDYGAYAYSALKNIIESNSIIIEMVEKNRYFLLRIRNGEINSDKLLNEEQMLQEVFQANKFKADTEDFQLIFCGSPNDQVRAMIERITTPVYQDALLSQTHAGKGKNSDLEIYRMRSVKEALTAPGVTRPKVKRTWAAIIASVALITFLLTSSEPLQSRIKVVDPYKELKVLLTGQAINPVGRLKQDYNIQIALLKLPGWELVSIDHMPTMSSYEVNQISRGTVKQLDIFAAKNGLSVAKLNTGYQIVVPGLNKPIHNMAKDHVYYHSMQNVTDIFISSVELFIPQVQVAIQKDQKGANDDWGKRQVVVNFAGHYREDLLTIAHIIEALELPIAFESANYKVDGEQLNGNLTLTIIGKVES